jgi:hypothetical protein
MQLEKFVWTGVAIGAALCIGTAPISAKPGAIKPTTPKMTAKVSSPKPTTHGSPKITTQGPKTTRPSTPKTTHVQGPKTTTHGQSATHTTKTTGAPTQTTTKTHGNPHSQPTDTTATGGTTTGGTTSGTTTGGTTTETTIPLTKAQQQLTKNTNLQSKLETRLGSQLPTNVTMIQAASGFKNLGQFVAAVNVSNNLGIPFSDLKAKMTGLTVDGKPITTTTGGTGGTATTASTTMSLGQAIQALKGVDSTTATQTANTATTQASTEISTTTTPTTAKPKKRH